jgi:putative transposase
MHKKLANQREDWQWKVAYELVSNYDIIKVEDLDIASMKALYGRKVSDLAYYNFLLKLEHLCIRYDKKLIKVDRYFPSSQICSNCGNIDKSMKDLNIREYNCKACYKIIGRDENAAINIENYNELLHKSLGKSLKSNKHKTSVNEAVCVPF